MFPGGITSLLLQSLHPLAMAGVAGHSGYKGDPWGRLQRTSHYLATTTFGTIAHAEEAIAPVRSIHERVRGKDRRGRPYPADDPHLLRWVHVAEIDSFLTATRPTGDEPLTAEEADLYVAQGGIPRRPARRVGPPTRSPSCARSSTPTVPSSRRRRPPARPPGSCLLNPPLPLMPAPATARSPRAACRCSRLGARDARHPAARCRVDPRGRPLGHLGTAAVRWGMAGLRADRAAAVRQRLGHWGAGCQNHVNVLNVMRDIGVRRNLGRPPEHPP